MSMIDPITDALTIIRNAELVSKKECEIKVASNFLGEILKIAQENEYIEKFEKTEEKGKIKYKVRLNGNMNTIKGIRPRHAVKRKEFEKFEKRYLPARDMGILIVSTPNGVMTHKDAKEKKIGGRLIAYIY